MQKVDDLPSDNSTVGDHHCRYHSHDAGWVWDSVPLNLGSSLYCHSIAVFALYNKSRPLLLFLWTIFLAEVAYLSYNLATITPRLGFAEDCFVRSSPPSFIFYWYVDTTFTIHLLSNRSPDWIGLSRSHLKRSSSSWHLSSLLWL